jgi:hypothetical protein
MNCELQENNIIILVPARHRLRLRRGGRVLVAELLPVLKVSKLFFSEEAYDKNAT